jgi:DNA modification methylase
MICNKYFTNVQPIFWKKSRSKNNTKNKLGAAVDVIFWCSNSKKPKFNMIYQELDAYYAENSYKNKDKRGNYALGHIVYTATQKVKSVKKEYLDAKGSGNVEVVEKLKKKLQVETEKELEKKAQEKDKERLYAFEHDGVTYEPENGWRLSKEALQELVDEDRVHFPKKEGANPYKKIYKHESKGKPCMDLWDDIHSIAMGNERRLYPTEKPEKLLERIIEMSSDVGDLVLDPVAGSGTTGVVAQNLKRRFALFDINPAAIEVAKERILGQDFIGRE